MPGLEFGTLGQKNQVVADRSRRLSVGQCGGMDRLHRRGRVEQQHIHPPTTLSRSAWAAKRAANQAFSGTGRRPISSSTAALTIIGPRAEQQHPGIVALLRDEIGLQ